MRIQHPPSPLYFKVKPGILHNEEFLYATSSQISQKGEVQLDCGYGRSGREAADIISRDDEFWHRLRQIDGIAADFSVDKYCLSVVHWVVPTLNTFVIIRRAKIEDPLDYENTDEEKEYKKDCTEENQEGVFSLEGYGSVQNEILEHAYKALKVKREVSLKRDEAANPSESYSITLIKRNEKEVLIDFRNLYQVQCSNTLSTIINFLLDKNETVVIIHGKLKINDDEPMLNYDTLNSIRLLGEVSYREEYRRLNWSKYAVSVLKRDEEQLT